MDFISAKLIFLAIVLFLLLGYWIFNFIILYHLTRFGIGTQPKKLAAIFLLGSVTIFFVSILLFTQVDFGSIKQRFEKIGANNFNITYPK